ncbi:hypothetical protein CRYUN_Cryun07bG0027900 [Craigia yunnanensis]
MFCAQEVGNVTSFASSTARAPSDYASTIATSSSVVLKVGVARNGSPPWREDNKDGHYMFELGDNLTSPYKIQSKMGEGTFGQVLECQDKEKKEMVAIKIVRGIKKYREAAMIEIEMLQQLGKHDKGGNRCANTKLDFEKFGPSLYDFLRKNNYRSFPIDLVRDIGRQLLEYVAFMHDLHLIHTDLKPEKILLVSPEYAKVPDYKTKDSSYYKRLPKSRAIKVIDFGSTTYERQDQTYIVLTRHYRALEAILGLGWSYPCDIWSVGCIYVELCTGEALFLTHENLEHLAMMERVLGPLPQRMLKRTSMLEGVDWIGQMVLPQESLKAVLKLPRLQNLIMQHVDLSAGDLIHLFQGLLRYDPVDRLTARDALRHPFLNESLQPRTFSNSSLMSFSSFSVTPVSFSVIFSTEIANVAVDGSGMLGSEPRVPMARKPWNSSDIVHGDSSS